MDQIGLFGADMAGEPGEGDNGLASRSALHRGPPNRLNDLVYRDWMKFQKSFFRHDSWQKLVNEFATFFTKRTWPDGRRSSTLVIGFPETRDEPFDRDIDVATASTSADIRSELATRAENGAKYDFVLVDLRSAVSNLERFDEFVTEHSRGFFAALRSILNNDLYCAVVLPNIGAFGASYPAAWWIAKAARDSLRLRDEKIGLVEEKESVYYCLIFQAADDLFPAELITSRAIIRAEDERLVPAWLVPKPPPRKKGELLHPAKFPETLIASFISLFTCPGDLVLDPMMGTASTLIAAIRANRHGIGVELSPHFFAIAKNRVDAELNTLFDEGLPGAGTAEVYLGDATKLDQIAGLKRSSVTYCVTSPPYWSMLNNPGSENQRARRAKGLSTNYSADATDLGNVVDYSQFLALLVSVYQQVAILLKPGGYLTVIVKNVKREHIVYPLAWDLVAELCGPDGDYDFVGNTFWCQDDVSMKPFAVGTHWVSNTVHQYCVHLRRRIKKPGRAI